MRGAIKYVTRCLPGSENSNRFRQPTRDDLGVFSLEITKTFGRVGLTSLTGYVDRTLELDRSCASPPKIRGRRSNGQWVAFITGSVPISISSFMPGRS
jgi:hypothetical protein